ncbi:LysR family transcriptional regulator [Paenibacillus psychroresistens]|uniref:LysR family transcriptional regulator n=1 Tax=Paenibacillus psychroresistens TaxID=1778678 RepID=A0A6B8RNS4_9BACL|nr:LysR family transcriptional regulator [Paenibacillus psychroresistens]QGQ97497.1 LysR family transcriptional regulator [Paenibacillus psychroresistens]
MDIRQLTAFLEIANQNNFSKASQILHISQPSLSKMIKGLEDELGIVLFDRSTRRIQLTEEGRIVREHAQIISNDFQNLTNAVSDMTKLKKGKLTLGLPPVIGSSFFPNVLASFHKQYPEIEISLIEEGGKRVEQSIMEGLIDLGIVVLPVNEQQFELIPLIQRNLCLVLPVQHPMSRKRKVYLKDLKNDPFILFRQEFNLYDRVRSACITEGFEPHITYESTQWDFICEMVAANQGISFLPETVCGNLDHKRLRVIKDIQPSIPWDLAVIWKKDQYVSHAAKAWIEFVRPIFQQNIT